MDDDNRPAVDATLDGRTPILPGPGDPPPLPGVDPAKFSAAVTAAVDARIEAVETRHTEQMDQFKAQSAKDQTIASLDMLLAGNPGDDLQSMQFRSKIVDLKMSVLGGTDTPLAEIITKAGELHTARMQVIQERGGDGSGDLPVLRRPTEGSPRGLFSIAQFMGALGKEVIRLGDKFEAEGMTGSPELEYAASILKDNPAARAQFAAIQGQADPRSRVVPVPVMALRPDAAFAETYAEVGTDGAERRERDYRRDALVPYPRPANVLMDIGVPMPIISNDLTLPRLDGAMAGSDVTETGNIADENLTVATVKTSAKRWGSRDDITWMLLAGGDAQFGHTPIVVNEMQRAWMARKTRGVLGGANTNAPTGIHNFAGTSTRDIGTTSPTYSDLLTMVTAIANKNIDVTDGVAVTDWTIKQELAETQRFGTGSASLLNETGYQNPGVGRPGGDFRSSMAGTIAGSVPCSITNHMPVTGTDRAIEFGLWGYIWCIDYATAFLTIDDISQAVSGQTRITLNTFWDIAKRWPAAFYTLTIDTA